MAMIYMYRCLFTVSFTIFYNYYEITLIIFRNSRIEKISFDFFVLKNIN